MTTILSFPFKLIYNISSVFTAVLTTVLNISLPFLMTVGLLIGVPVGLIYLYFYKPIIRTSIPISTPSPTSQMSTIPIQTQTATVTSTNQNAIDVPWYYNKMITSVCKSDELENYNKTACHKCPSGYNLVRDIRKCVPS